MTSSFFPKGLGQQPATHQLQQELDALRQRLQQIQQQQYCYLDAVPHMTIVIDVEGCIRYGNQSWQRFTGHSGTISVGVPFWQTLQPRDATAITSCWHHALKTQASVELHCSFQEAAGGDRPFTLTIHPICLDGSPVIEWLGTFTPLDDLPPASTPAPSPAVVDATLNPALNELEYRFQTIFNRVFQFIGLLSPAGILLEANQTALDFGGLQRSQVVGYPFWDASWWQLSPETQTQLKKAIAQAAQGKFVRYEVDVLGANGAIATIDFSLQPVYNDQGEVILLIPEGRDISDLRRVEAEVRQLNSQLEERVQERTAELAAMNQRLQQEICDRQRIEAALRQSEHQFRLVAETMPQIVWTALPDGAVDYYNQRWTEYSGIPQEKGHNWGWKPVLHPDDEQLTMNAWSAAVATNTLYECVHRVRRSDGEFRWFISRAMPLQDAEGKTLKWFGTATEIHHQFQIQEQLRESEERFRQLAETIDDVFWLFELDTEKMLYISTSYETLWGYSCESLYTDWKHWLDSVHPEDQPLVQDRFVTLKASGSFDAIYRIVCPDESVRWVRDRAYPIYDESGTLYRVAGLAEDITERKQAEIALAESESRLRQFAEADIIGILFGDIHGAINYANDAFLRIIGYDREDLEAGLIRWDTITPPEFLALDTCSILEAQKTGRCTPYEKEYLRKDGSRIPVLVGFILLEEAREASVAFVLDISDRKQAEADLQLRAQELAEVNQLLMQTTLDLERRNRELDKFAYVASHDLKAPLRAISNLSEWIEEDVGDLLPEESQQHFQLLRKRVYRMEAFIKGLLTYSRAGRMVSPPEMVDVRLLLMEDVMEMLDLPASFTLEITSPMPTLMAHRQSLQQVFYNLISNAIYHNPAQNGTIVISAQEQENHYEFAIADNGPGIEPQYHSRIFEIFQTLRSRDEKEGAGIGLSIVKKIVEMEGGTIWVKSDLGQGATFHFTWLKHPLTSELASG